MRNRRRAFVLLIAALAFGCAACQSDRPAFGYPPEPRPHGLTPIPERPNPVAAALSVFGVLAELWFRGHGYR